MRAKEARSRGADHYLYITSDLSFYEMPAIERYLAKRGYRAEYRGCAPCGSPYCRVMHTTIAVFW